MANVRDAKLRATKITLSDGVERVLKFDLNALSELEDRYGTVEKAFKALDSGSVKAVRCILWAGFLHTEEGLTEKQVGSLLDLEYMQYLQDTLGEALDASMPTAEQIGEKLPELPTVGIPPNA